MIQYRFQTRRGLSSALPDALPYELVLATDTNKLYAGQVGGGLVLVSGGGATKTVVKKTANYTAAGGEFVEVDSSAGPVTITLPKSSDNASKEISVKKISADSNLVTVARSNTDLVEFDTSVSFDMQGLTLDFIADGVTAWGIE